MTAEPDLLPLPSGNVAHLIAAQASEIEALRAARDLFRDETIELVRQNGEWQARAGRLTEALRGMMAEYEALHARHELGECQATVDARAALRDHDQEDRND